MAELECLTFSSLGLRAIYCDGVINFNMHILTRFIWLEIPGGMNMY